MIIDDNNNLPSQSKDSNLLCEEDEILSQNIRNCMSLEAASVPEKYARRHFLRSIVAYSVAAGVVTGSSAMLETQAMASVGCGEVDKIVDPFCFFTDKACDDLHKQPTCQTKLQCITQTVKL